MRYGEREWKSRYYTSKLGLDAADAQGRALVTGHYVRGLCWVLMYYYQGVQDWGWYYPFHYAPCASELLNLAEFAGGQVTRLACTCSPPRPPRLLPSQRLSPAPTPSSSRSARPSRRSSS